MRTLAVVLALAACGDVVQPAGDTPVELTFTALEPTWGSRAGGTAVTIRGTGFTSDLAVRFGSVDVPAQVLGDGELIAIAPPGPLSPVSISLVAGDRVVAGPTAYRYLAPLYAADGRRANNEAYPAYLYLIDPEDGTSTQVGELGARLTGLALSPDGVLWGVTMGGTQRLVTIDPYTAAMTDRGVLAQVDQFQRDITFGGTRLCGWNGVAMTSIDRSTQLVTPTPQELPSGKGNGFASRGTEAYLAPQLASGRLYRVDTATGQATPGPLLDGAAVSVNSMTFVGTTLLGALNTNATTVTLSRIDPQTGAVRAIGTLPPRVDAIAGIAAE